MHLTSNVFHAQSVKNLQMLQSSGRMLQVVLSRYPRKQTPSKGAKQRQEKVVNFIVIVICGTLVVSVQDKARDRTKT
jgi:calcineurin-like phosphoesterase family protein